MRSRLGKLAFLLMTLVMLLTLALGPVAPGLVAQVAEPWISTVEVESGLHGLLAGPTGDGGSG